MAPQKIVILFIASMIFGMSQQFMMVLMWRPPFCGGPCSDEHADCWPCLNPPLVLSRELWTI